MPSSNVEVGLPLIRVPSILPGQLGGIAGRATETGLRVHPTGTVFYVDTNYTGVRDAGGVVDRDGTDPRWPLATITQALAKCQSYRGDIILVMGNGFWINSPQTAGYALPVTETVEVDVHGVTIRGVFASSSLGVPWRAVAAGDTILTISAIDVLVEGFNFQGESAAGGANCNGIYAEWDGVTLWADCFTLRNCFFDEDILVAVQLEFSWDSDIHDCTFQRCATAGIYVDPAGSGISTNRIYKNWFTNVGEGATGALSLQGAERCDIHHNTIYNDNAQGAALATDEGIDTAGGVDNMVHHNSLSCLLPVPANGDYDDFCSESVTDAWMQNYCMDGPSVTNPT